MKLFDTVLRIFRSPRNNPGTAPEAALSFDGLNPLLAKQLSELESQIGQLAQVQFELSQERKRMRDEMEALRKAVGQSEADPSRPNSDNEATQ